MENTAPLIPPIVIVIVVVPRAHAMLRHRGSYRHAECGNLPENENENENKKKKNFKLWRSPSPACARAWAPKALLRSPLAAERGRKAAAGRGKKNFPRLTHFSPRGLFVLRMRFALQGPCRGPLFLLQRPFARLRRGESGRQRTQGWSLRPTGGNRRWAMGDVSRCVVYLVTYIRSLHRALQSLSQTPPRNDVQAGAHHAPCRHENDGEGVDRAHDHKAAHCRDLV